MPTQKGEEMSVCVLLLSTTSIVKKERKKEKNKNNLRSINQCGIISCMCVSVQISFGSSLDFFVSVSCTVCVCYISIICWWIQKSGIHVDGKLLNYLFFFNFFLWSLTLRFYTCTRSCNYWWRLSGSSQTQYGSGPRHYMPPTVYVHKKAPANQFL